MTTAAAKPNPFAYRDFSYFWAARFLMTLGVSAQSVALGWQVYAVARLTRTIEASAFLVGMIGLAQFLPLFALTFIAGAVADHADRKKIVAVSLAVEVVATLALAALALTPTTPLLAIFALAAVMGAARAFQSPAMGSMAPMLVPGKVLPRAIATSSLAWQSGSVVGPWLGGALCALSPAYAYAVSGLLFVASLTSVFAIRADTQPKQTLHTSRLALVREGVVYVWTNKIVLGAISLDLFAVLLGGATALLPVYARDVLKVGETGFGLLRSAPAIGAGLMALYLARHPIRRHAGLWMFAGVAVYGLGTVVFSVSTVMWLSMFSLVLLGAADMISVFVRQTLVQIVTPDPMRGRVSAVSGLFIGASNELGEFESGVAAGLFGPVVAALAGGVGALIVTGLWARLFPALRQADSLTGEDARAA
jgi:MFS family permease